MISRGERVTCVRGLSSPGSGPEDRVNNSYVDVRCIGAIGPWPASPRCAPRPRLQPGDARLRGEPSVVAEAVFDRYLNRVPTITIRAGHRVRIYFTSDAAVPRTTLGLPAVR